MKRYSFEPPTENYDENIEPIDEQICKLLEQRKNISDDKSVFPPQHLISDWSEKYNFYEEFLNVIFSSFLNEAIFKPVPEPKGFIKNIPVLKAFENNGVFYSVTFVRQFKNVSIVQFNIDRAYQNYDMPRDFAEHTLFNLSIDGFECHGEGGGGSDGHESFSYIVSPALPDDLSQIKLVFKEHQSPYQKQTGFEVEI